MTIGAEILTSTAFLGIFVTILGYFVRRWMERIEVKVDQLMEYRVACRASMVTRDEYIQGLNRVHARMDEHLAEEQELSSRLSRLEGSR